MGEAMNRILKISPNIQITSARRIVNTRNYLIHGYDSLREDLIWAIVINHLPLLKSEVTKLIESSQEVR
ncbi:HepT-like ribonuclease domain-containing protein [Muribaculum intestinale]|uniref:HepT-like ribonuclease domain-containing protein n=1 Tax=Muribaculum intestinale TaxID=1796646 RepID=UPI0031192E8E